MSEPKPFQVAAVDAAVAAFTNAAGRRRFLVADEVGLGKTVVAREVARTMANHGKRPFIIYYIASGHSVSHQNKRRIVAFLDSKDREAAVATPDRLSLIAVSKRPNNAVLIYALTPGTSFPGARMRLTGGRKEERAFLKALLEKAYPAFNRHLDPTIMRLNVGESWNWLVSDARKKLAVAPPNLIRRFREALAEEFGKPVRDALDLAVSGDAAKKIPPLTSRVFVGRLRRALALATLRHQPPDLVILDEFQRYRHVLYEKDPDRLLQALLEPADATASPAVLLLSATPYRLLGTRWDEARGALAHEELLQLIAFLAGPAARERARVLFTAFGDKLHDIAAHAQAGQRGPAAELGEAARLRDELRALLTPVMSRTERDCVVKGDLLPGTCFLDASPEPQDFQVYRHLVESFRGDTRYEALPYWSSVPLPAQSLGPRYAAWKRATIKAAPSRLPCMTRERRNRLNAPAAWPDAKLRALGDIAPSTLLSLPWVAPSMGWWPLGGGWKDASREPKLLMFSRFRATPPSVAALLSFGVEANCLQRVRGGYDKVYRRRRFKLAAMPGPVMAAFHPSPWLIRNTNPLAGAGSLAHVRREVRRQILAALPKNILDRKTAKARRRHRSIGMVLAAIEKWAGLAEQSAQAWSTAIGDDRAARSAVQKWRRADPIERLSPIELHDLVTYAISAPGVVLGRALLRHDHAILDVTRYGELVRLSWQGLRAYLDNPVILASLPGRSAVDQVMRAVVDGCLESVLDEHFWLRAQNLPEGGAGLASDLLSSLGLRAGAFSFHGIGRSAHKISIRCHVAVPFGDAEAEPVAKARKGAIEPAAPAPARPDEVRRSFNTPFWPHVLATTSVGQEGLDFHPWCSNVVHWDLSSNPLDLEQREGRIQRYAGLAIRRRLSCLLQEKVLLDVRTVEVSPWNRLQTRAGDLVDKTGLSPWWVLDNADIRRYVFERPFGRDMMRFARLREQRMIYRLALGQPNQEDFIEILSRGGLATSELLRPLVLDLSAMGVREITT